jgi:hypothetical protein
LLSAAFFIVLLNIVMLNVVYAECRGTNKNKLAYSRDGYSHLAIEGASL